MSRCGNVGDCYVMRFVCHLGVFNDGTTQRGVVGDNEENFNKPNENPKNNFNNKRPHFWWSVLLARTASLQASTGLFGFMSIQESCHFRSKRLLFMSSVFRAFILYVVHKKQV